MTAIVNRSSSSLFPDSVMPTVTKCSVTLKDISSRCGVSIAKVSRALRCVNDTNNETVKMIRETAANMGYVPASQRKQERLAQNEWIQKANFATKALETERMLSLRNQGYSNREIAQKVGRCVLTIRRRIGAQDPAMSDANRILGQKHRAQRNAERRMYVEQKKINDYNAAVNEYKEMQERVEQMKAAVASLLVDLASSLASVESLKPDAEKAMAWMEKHAA